MKIYTKTGDDGTTGLFGGGRIPKHHRRIQAYGDVDELNSVIGMCRTADTRGLFIDLFISIQNTLFVLGADLATPLSAKVTHTVPRITDADVKRLEDEIDANDRQLPELTAFILPGGTMLSSHLHFARAVARRAERSIVALSTEEPITEADIRYINRLSDLLFVMARRANAADGINDTPWTPAAG